MIRKRPQPKRYYQPEIECAPLSLLAAQVDQRLADSQDLFERAAQSPLYRERWQQAGVQPRAIHSYQDFQSIPFSHSTDLRAAQQAHLPDAFICSPTRPRLWYCTSGSTGAPKWIPVGASDLKNNRQVYKRLAYFGDQPSRPGEVAFSITAPAPFISDTSHWRSILQDLTGDRFSDIEPVESIVFSFETGTEGISMALKRRITSFFAFPSLVMRIAEGISANAGRIAESRIKERFSLPNLLAYWITRHRTIQPKHLLKVRSGIFAGEPLEPYRQALFAAWGIQKAYNLYTSSEFQVPFCECYAQDGLHTWLDVAIPEIIPAAELEALHQDPNYEPQAIPIWQTQDGDEGELVLTNFSETFPLIRWRTSDLVRIVSLQPCQCGRTSPRLQILQRVDDLVNLGVIRFSIFSLQDQLAAIRHPSPITRWQLRVARQGYKPLLKVLVRPAGECDPALFRQTVHQAVNQIAVIREGWQNGLIAEPVIELVPDLGDRLSSSGKFRPLVYEELEHAKAS
ncbi:MAG: phenylacetate--CoA ligase family protein [Anaerolineales bacterium]|nr:phenylacetate--CoA ligase family protein [Anaerolineales bacterium]